MDGEERNFSSPEEAVQYWKDVATDYKQRLEEAKEELDEFQMSSHELEAELEAQLEQVEQKNKDLVAANQRLQMEVDILREKLEIAQTTNHKQVTELEDELAQVKAYKDELQKYIRELEQSNDDLERAKRATVVSLEDFEARLNSAIERNAFLESELEEKDSMAVTVQRLKDEARDLRQELHVVHTKPGSPREEKSFNFEKKETPNNEQIIIDSNKLADSDFITPQGTPAKPPQFNNTQNGTPLTPSARISALNIVGDLLRKVGALESKLASCRNFVKDQPRSNKSGPSSPLNSPSWADYLKIPGFLNTPSKSNTNLGSVNSLGSTSTLKSSPGSPTTSSVDSNSPLLNHVNGTLSNGTFSNGAFS